MCTDDEWVLTFQFEHDISQDMCNMMCLVNIFYIFRQCSEVVSEMCSLISTLMFLRNVTEEKKVVKTMCTAGECGFYILV